ncbi:MAG: hypothetical protein HW380_3270 [Magnetococcales bacterium]|nr:hypothetical protein [Magnetococcales bacterium]
MFVVTQYIPDQDGCLRPKVPTVGPCEHSDGRPCRIFSDHDRERKTGPCYPIRVVRCRTHNKSFTLYPPGHVPHGRKSVGNLAENGSSIFGLTGTERFKGTIFDAALDADKQLFWPLENGDFHVNPNIVTQANYLNRSKELLGIQPDISDEQRFIISHILMVSVTFLLDAANRMLGKVDLQTQGQIIREILEKIPPFESSLFERFVAVGTYLGRWAHLHVWDPVHQYLIPSKVAQFYSLGTRASPG